MNSNSKIDDGDRMKSNEASHDGFVSQLMFAAKNGGIDNEISYDVGNFAIDVKTSSSDVKINLSSSFEGYRDAEMDQREHMMKSYVDAIRKAITVDEKLAEPFSAVRSHLVPIVCSRIETDNEFYGQPSDAVSEFRPTPRQKFGSDANVVLMYDMATMAIPVREEHLNLWGVSFDDALEIGMENLSAMSSPAFREIKPGLFIGLWNDPYVVSRVLLPALFAADDRFDEPVVMIPFHGCICIASKWSIPSQLTMLDYVTHQLSRTVDVVSTRMYHFVDGQAVEYTSDDAEIMVRLNMIRRPLLWEYSMRQKRVVQEYLKNRGDQTFLSTLMVMEDKGTGGYSSMCVWLDEKDTIFPEVDFIAIGDTRGEIGGYRTGKPIPWSDAMKKFARRIQRMDGFPNLYRVSLPAQKSN